MNASKTFELYESFDTFCGKMREIVAGQNTDVKPVPAAATVPAKDAPVGR
jgi:hypothetical protein